MIDIARIDHWAASGTGPLHRASTISKILFLLLVVAAAVTARSAYPLIAGYVLILAVAAAAGLPWKRMVPLSLYAVLFALLYAITLRGGGSTYLLLACKAVTPSLAMLLLVVTTPYPRIFSLLGIVLPEVLASGLFMAYRTLFILLDMMDNFVAAIRLRGGFSAGSLFKNSSNIARGIAMLLVKAVERSTRLYAVMSVRGYSGSMAQEGGLALRKEDCIPYAVGVLVLSFAIFWSR